jgi:hypothetical protein
MKILKKIKRSKFLTFIKNVWLFRNELNSFQRWDYRYNLSLFKKSFELTADYIEKYGYEIDETRLVRVERMRNFIKLLNNIDGDTISIAENILNLKTQSNYTFESIEDRPGYSRMIDNLSKEDQENNQKIYDLSNKITEDEWIELCSIFKDDMRGWWD